MRTFIAIELPLDIKEKLSWIQDKLSRCGADINWVSANNMHLTLKFLGEIDQGKLNAVIKATEEITQDKFQFGITLLNLGVFPSPNFPKVIWAGIEEGNSEIIIIAKALEEKLERLGIPKEGRPFSSHITLGRTRAPTNKDRLLKSLNILKDEFSKNGAGFIADKITIFKSTLTPGGPLYEALKEIALKAT